MFFKKVLVFCFLLSQALGRMLRPHRGENGLFRDLEAFWKEQIDNVAGVLDEKIIEPIKNEIEKRRKTKTETLVRLFWKMFPTEP